MKPLPRGVISRTAITRGWQIPECEFYVWTTHPDPDTGTGGTGSLCRARATHRITTIRTNGEKTYPCTIDLCRAHIAEEIDAAYRDRENTWRFHYTRVPEPTLTELDLVLDVRAYAHGTKRLWLTEREYHREPIVLELFGTSPLIPVPRRRSRPATAARRAGVHQTALLDERGHPAHL